MSEMMQMTEFEICASYRQAKNKREQVKILAELNLRQPKDIAELLARNGCTIGVPKPRKMSDRIIQIPIYEKERRAEKLE